MASPIQLGGHTFKASRHLGWEATIPMQGWSADDSPIEISVSIETDFDLNGNAKSVPPHAEQIAALEFLLAKQVQTAKAALTATLLYVQELFDKGVSWYDFTTRPESEEDLFELLDGASIVIHRQSVDGFAWLGISAGCEWEVEHGHGIAMWKDIVLDVGYADVSMMPTSATSLPLDQRQEERHRIVEILQREAEDAEENAHNELLASLPPGVRLVQAILSRQTEEAERLRREGADINASVKPYEPAIFAAMHSQDPEIVAAMIDAGASVKVKNRERQTPLEFANQMVETHSMGSQLRAGQAGALNAMMSNLLGGQNLFGSASRDEPLKQMEDSLRGMGAQGGMLGAAADHMQKMLDQLAGGFAERMKNASPQQREYLEDVSREGDLMLSNWQKIQQLIEDRLASGAS